jgi:hypothetical protein
MRRGSGSRDRAAHAIGPQRRTAQQHGMRQPRVPALAAPHRDGPLKVNGAERISKASAAVLIK